MKHKGAYAVAVVAMLAFMAGCGAKGGERDAKATEAATPTVAPTATATPKPTATPTPTPTPVPANYMEANGIEILGAGAYTYKGYINANFGTGGEEEMVLAEYECYFEVSQEENGDGTKTIQAALHNVPYVYEGGSWAAGMLGGFVDINSGKSFFPKASNVEQTTILKQDKNEIEIKLKVSTEPPTEFYPYYTERYTLVCPAEYEDAAFYLSGYNWDTETYAERFGLWKKLNYIRHGESDMLVFGVNKGLETMPENGVVKAAAVAESQSGENYFETHGLTTRDEGKVTFLGTEAYYEMVNGETVEGSIVVETKELEIRFRKSEEIKRDGTKVVRGSFVFPVELVENQETGVTSVKMMSCSAGVVDKKSGLVYPAYGYKLASPVVVKHGEEEISMMIAYEDSLSEDGTYAHTFIITCPEDYNDYAFVLTGYYMDEEQDDESDVREQPEWKPLSEIEHGETDILFFE